MKKLLISLTVLFSLFLGVNNVSAQEIEAIYTVTENIFDSTTYSNDFKSYSIYQKLKDSNNYDTYKESILSLGYKYYYFNYDSVYVWNSDDIQVNIYMYYSSSNPTLQIIFYNPNNEVVKYVNLKNVATNTSSLNDDSKYTKLNFHNMYHFTSATSSVGASFSGSYYKTSELNYYYFMGFDTNTTIYYNCPTNENYYKYFSVNGTTYTTGDVIYSPGPKNYKYNQEIDTTNLSYIRVDFDVSKATYEDYHFSILNNVNSKLKEAYFEKSYEWGICIDENTCYDNYIFRDTINYTESYKMYSISSPFKVEDSEHGFYDETQALNYFYTYYDVSNINDIVTLDIDSTVPFSVSFGNLEDYTDTFVTLNLKNYAGIVLFPKVNLYNGDYNFYLKNANVNVHHYYENNLVNIYKNVIVETYRIDQVEYQDRNRYYLIENNVIDIDSYISFDTRYFSYQLVNSTSESITIINPNTNENQNIDSIDNSNLNYDIQHKLDNVDGAIGSINEFIEDMKQYLFIISDLISYTYNNLNSYCRTLIIVAFIVLLIVGLSLIFRR